MVKKKTVTFLFTFDLNTYLTFSSIFISLSLRERNIHEIFTLLRKYTNNSLILLQNQKQQATGCLRKVYLINFRTCFVFVLLFSDMSPVRKCLVNGCSFTSETAGVCWWPRSKQLEGAIGASQLKINVVCSYRTPGPRWPQFLCELFVDTI